MLQHTSRPERIRSLPVRRFKTGDKDLACEANETNWSATGLSEAPRRATSYSQCLALSRAPSDNLR